MQQLQQRTRKDLSQCHFDQANNQAQQKGRMHRFLHVFMLPCAKEPCRNRIHTAANANQETGKQRDQDGRRANGAKRLRPGKPANHSDVRHIEQRLQDV